MRGGVLIFTAHIVVQALPAHTMVQTSIPHNSDHDSDIRNGSDTHSSYHGQARQPHSYHGSDTLSLAVHGRRQVFHNLKLACRLHAWPCQRWKKYGLMGRLLWPCGPPYGVPRLQAVSLHSSHGLLYILYITFGVHKDTLRNAAKIIRIRHDFSNWAIILFSNLYYNTHQRI